MRVLLVCPAMTGPGGFYFLPLGLAYISAQMKRDGHEVHCLNPNHQADPLELLVRQAMCLYDPDVVATGGVSGFLEFSRSLFAIARRVKPEVITLLGGSGITAEPELFMRCTSADIGVLGEGEQTVHQLLAVLASGRSRKDMGEVPGIIFRTPDDRLARTLDRKPSRSIMEFPWPDLEGFGYGQSIEEAQNIADFTFFPASVVERPRVVPIITSRACPYGCTFCFHTTGRAYTERTLDDVFAELDHHVKLYNPNFLLILDEIFCMKTDRLLEFCRRIKPYQLKWWCQLHIQMVKPGLLAEVRDAGCVGLSYGLESMNKDVLDSMDKKNDPTQVSRILRDTYEGGLDIQGNFIFGDRAETLQTAEETLAWWEEHVEYGINLSMLALYPKSEIYTWAAETGRIRNLEGFIKAGCPVINSSGMDDVSYAALRVRIYLYTFLRRYGSTSIPVEDEGRSRMHGVLHRFSAECPHCHHESEYRNVAVPDSGVLAFTLACRKCYRRFTPAIAKRRAVPGLVEARAVQAGKLFRAGSLDGAEALCLENLAEFPRHAESWHVLAGVLTRQGSHHRAFSAAYQAASYDPANPDFLETLADLAPHGNLGELLAQGESQDVTARASAPLRRQAAWLRGQGISGMTFATVP